jgi:signal transduction histidine kinase
LKPVENITTGKGRGSGSLNTPRDTPYTSKTSVYDLAARMNEMSELNAQLTNLVEQRTKKLAEVRATNTKFISIIAHDLRSPFNAILGSLDILESSLNHFDKVEFKSFINMAIESATNTLNLLDNLLTWTISQNQQKSFVPIKINLNELITAEVESTKDSASPKQISIIHSITPDLNVTADIQMVKMIIRNLISNAIKYTNFGGEIFITAVGVRQYVELTVKDNGIGISEEAQKGLFKIEAVHSTSGTNKEKGTGLGLILCKEFVEIHGGTILVRSEPGRGCAIKFTLPHYI